MNRGWIEYAVAGLVLTIATAGVLMLIVAPSDRSAVLFAAAVSYPVQLVAFAVLVAVRDNAQLFMLGWVGGMVLRFATVGAVVMFLSRTSMFPRRPALLSLIGFVFMLTLLESVFLRRVRDTP